MKNHILITILLLTTIKISAQNDVLLSANLWEIREHSTEVSGERYVYFNSDSLNNINALTNKGFEFQTSGLFNSIVDGNINATGDWLLNTAQDSLTMDLDKFQINTLDQDSLVLKTSAIKFGLEVNTFLKFVSNPSLSVDNFNFNRYIEVFPNPASDKLNLKFNDLVTSNLKEIVILNTLGKYVFTSPLDNSDLQSVSLESLSNGIYFIKIMDESNTAIAVKRFVVNK